MTTAFTPKGLANPAAGDCNWDDDWHNNSYITDMITAQLASNNRLVSGGLISALTGLDVNIDAGSAYIAGTLRTWIQTTKTASAGALELEYNRNYLYIDSSGVVQINTTPPSGDYLLLGFVDATQVLLIRVIDLRLQIGNAASMTKTESITDKNVGRALKVGDWGIGDSAVLSVVDFNTLPETLGANGLVVNLSNNGSTNGPHTGGYYYVQHFFSEFDVPLNCTQLLIPYLSSSPHAIWYRVRSSNVWSSWVKVLDTNDKTSSSTDSTTGKLLKVGDFGLGGTSFILITGESVKADRSTGFYIGGSLSNVPSAVGVNWCYLKVHRYTSVYTKLTLTQMSGAGAGNIYEAVNINGTWSDWVQVLNSAHVTQGQTDTTFAKLLKVGDWGLGEADCPTESLRDLNTIANGIFYASSAVNGPDADGTNRNAPILTALYDGSGSKYGFQIAGRGSGAPLQYRGVNANVWEAWRILFHQGNILGSVSQSSGVPTGAIIESGINANGRYAKFADGTLICTSEGKSLTSTTSAAFGGFYRSSGGNSITWTFPSTFFSSASPVVTAYAQYDQWVLPSSITANEASLAGVALTNSTAVGIRAMAIGRWF